MLTSKPRILVVDDDRLGRVKLSVQLEEAGCEVALAENGVEALEMLRRESFDTVLLDLLMPVMDGFTALREMKTDPALQHLPVIVISAEDDLDSVVRCIEMGAADYLPKPFNPVLLRARVGACVHSKRSHDREMALYGELQQRYQQLKELQQLRDDLTHMIVHDLRTPLTSLLAGLELVAMIGALTPSQAECLDVAGQGGKGLLSMINELLDISKMEDGSLELERSETTPSELWQQALTQVNSLAIEKDLLIEAEIQDGLPSIEVDVEMMVRVLVNLCSNAIKFTPVQGTITVGAGLVNEEPSQALLFWVADTGKGIPAEQFERIFEKFGQVDSRRSGRNPSTGLGLTFCKMTVEKHGGRIWVESELGEGSRFSLVIPFVREEK